MIRHYFLRGEYKGNNRATLKRVHESRVVPSGRAYFCPKCAEIWAFFPVDRQETYVDHVLCEKHESAPSREYPGCLMLPWEEEFNKDLPTELLVREFLLTLAIKEKENGSTS